jgi:hypothetical protein
MPLRTSPRAERLRRRPARLNGATGFLSDAVARSELASGQEVKARLRQKRAQGFPVEAKGSPVAARDDPQVQLRGSAGDVRVGRGHDGRGRPPGCNVGQVHELGHRPARGPGHSAGAYRLPAQPALRGRQHLRRPSDFASFLTASDGPARARPQSAFRRSARAEGETDMRPGAGAESAFCVQVVPGCSCTLLTQRRVLYRLPIWYNLEQRTWLSNSTRRPRAVRKGVWLGR